MINEYELNKAMKTADMSQIKDISELYELNELFIERWHKKLDWHYIFLCQKSVTENLFRKYLKKYAPSYLAPCNEYGTSAKEFANALKMKYPGCISEIDKALELGIIR